MSTKFTYPVHYEFAWWTSDEYNEATGNYLYHAYIDFDVEIEIDTPALQWVKCTVIADTIKLNYTTGNDKNSFIDVIIATWNDSDRGYDVIFQPFKGYQYERWDPYVKEEFEKAIPDSIDNAICGLVLINDAGYYGGNGKKEKLYWPKNYTKTFKLNGELPEKFNFIAGIGRGHDVDEGYDYEQIDPVHNRVAYTYMPNAFTFTADPYLKYYPMAIRKNNVWQSCNRFGRENRVGFDKILKGSTHESSFNFFSAEEKQRVHIKDKNGKWQIALPTGENQCLG